MAYLRCTYKWLIIALTLIPTAASAETITAKIPWKGDYLHNSSKTWSRDNPYDSGFSKNFLNGTPEEGGKVQKDGELNAEIILPNNTTGPIPFMLVLHGCTGLDNTTDVWAHHVAQVLNDEGVGVLILNSFLTRSLHKTCGMPDFHWGRRRADDAYSALDYLVEHKLAKPDEVYIMGQSNGGLTTLIALSKQENDHKNQFKKRATPMQLIVYKDANHGFMFNYLYPLIVKGWTDPKGHDHDWHLSSNPAAEKDMMQTIIPALKTKKFVNGVDFRQASK
jgi:dienelactone hydrolase